MKNDKTIQIPTSANPDALENTLTQDITTLEAIYDLIDNSIDAARRDIFKNQNFTADEYGMPKDYSGYSIEVIVNDKEISIADNCLGFSKDELENNSLILGQPSNHEFGIGQYGVGLKRSLLKIGNKYTLNTDDKKNRFRINFTNKDFNSGKGFISSLLLKSNNKKMTSLKINSLKQGVLPDIKSNMWYENAIEGMNQRYTIYLEKGLVISIKYFENEPKKIKSSLVKLRHDSRFKPFKKSYKLNNDVTVIISAGIHNKYKFKGELGYSLSGNRKITNEYGIYIICNDRVIVASSKEKMHGWKTNWHSEYNGFVCIVRFISQNPSLLPINTAKTAIQVDSAIFLEAAHKIQPIADDYRKNIKHRYSTEEESIQFGSSLEEEDAPYDYNYVDKEPDIQTEDILNNEEFVKNKATDKKQNSTSDKKQQKPKINITKIHYNEKIHDALLEKNNRKLDEIYNSICTLSIRTHGSIIVIAISVFYESLALYLGKNDSVSVDSYFTSKHINSKMPNKYSTQKTKDFHTSFKSIVAEANKIKHNETYNIENAINMVSHMKILEEVTLDLILCMDQIS